MYIREMYSKGIYEFSRRYNTAQIVNFVNFRRLWWIDNE